MLAGPDGQRYTLIGFRRRMAGRSLEKLAPMQRSYSDGFRRALGLALALVLLAGAAAGQETREPVDMVREVTALATGVPERAAALIHFEPLW